MKTDIRFICGWGSDIRIWNKLLSRLNLNAEHCRFIDPQQILKSPKDFSACKNADTIIGWSLGAMMALEAALENPEIKRLILISGTPSFCHTDYGWAPRILDRMINRLNSQPEKVIERFNQTVAAELLDSDTYRHQFAYDIIRRNWSVEELINGLNYMKTFDLSASLNEIEAETLWIHGVEDKICSINALQVLPENMQQLILDNSGHLM